MAALRQHWPVYYAHMELDKVAKELGVEGEEPKQTARVCLGRVLAENNKGWLPFDPGTDAKP